MASTSTPLLQDVTLIEGNYCPKTYLEVSKRPFGPGTKEIESNHLISTLSVKKKNGFIPHHTKTCSHCDLHLVQSNIPFYCQGCGRLFCQNHINPKTSLCLDCPNPSQKNNWQDCKAYLNLETGLFCLYLKEFIDKPHVEFFINSSCFIQPVGNPVDYLFELHFRSEAITFRSFSSDERNRWIREIEYFIKGIRSPKPWGRYSLSLFHLVQQAKNNETKKLLDEKEFSIEALNHAILLCSKVPAEFDQESTNCTALLLNKGADLKILDCFRNSLLHWAVTKNKPLLVNFLLDRHIKIFSLNDDLQTPFMIAQQKKLQNIEQQLEQKVTSVFSIFAEVSGEFTIFSFSDGLKKNNQLTINQLINFQNNEGNGLLHLLCRDSKYTEILDFLIEEHKKKKISLNRNIRNQYNQTPLHLACLSNIPSSVSSLCRSASSSVICNVGWTPLHVAISVGATECVKILLKDENVEKIINTQTEDSKKTPIEISFLKGHTDIFDLLLQIKNINPESIFKNQRELNPNDEIYSIKILSLNLVKATKKGDISEVKKLLAQGADASMTFQEKSALTIARETSNSSLLRILQEHKRKTDIFEILQHGTLDSIEEMVKGIKMNILDLKNQYERNLLHIASITGRFQSVQKIKEIAGNQGPSLAGMKDCYGRTPLHYAASTGNLESIKLLISLNPKTPSISDQNQKLPFHYAIESNHLDAVISLEEHTICNFQQENFTSSDPKIKQFLIQAGNKRQLLEACKNENVSVISQLWSSVKEKDIPIATSEGKITIMEVAINSRNEYLKSLIFREKKKVSTQSEKPEDILQTVENMLSNFDSRVSMPLDNNENTILHKLCAIPPSKADVKYKITEIFENFKSPREVVNLRNLDGRTPLFNAAEQNNDKIVRLLLENGADISITDNQGKKAKNYATAQNVLNLLNFYEQREAFLINAKEGNIENLNQVPFQITEHKSEDLQTALHLCASGRTDSHVTFAQLLLQRNPTLLSKKDINGKTALDIAEEAKNKKMVDLLSKYELIPRLVEACAKGDAKTVRECLESNSTIVHKKIVGDVLTWVHLLCALFETAGAEEDKYFECLEVIFEYKPNAVNIPNCDGETPLHWCAALGHTKLMKFLTEEKRKPNLESKQKSDCTPLVVAISCGKLECAKILIERNANVTSRDSHGRTPLMILCKYAEVNDECLLYLLKHIERDDIDLLSDEGDTALLIAAQRGNTELVKLLLQHGADPKVENQQGLTPLIAATECGNHELVKLLMKSGAHPVPNKNNESAISHAAEGGKTECLAIMLTSPIIPSNEEELLSMPLNYAILHRHKDCIELLLKYGAESLLFHFLSILSDVFDEDDQHYEEICLLKQHSINLQLLSACEQSSFGAVEQALKENADVDYTTVEGNTPLKISLKKGNSKIVQLLLEYGASIPPDIMKEKNIPGGILNLIDKYSKGLERFPELLKLAEKEDDSIQSFLTNESFSFSRVQKHEVLLKMIQQGKLKSIKHLSSFVKLGSIKDSERNTPFHVAAKFDQVEIMRELINWVKIEGCEDCIKDLNLKKQTCYDLAEKSGGQRILIRTLLPYFPEKRKKIDTELEITVVTDDFQEVIFVSADISFSELNNVLYDKFKKNYSEVYCDRNTSGKKKGKDQDKPKDKKQLTKIRDDQQLAHFFENLKQFGSTLFLFDPISSPAPPPQPTPSTSSDSQKAVKNKSKNAPPDLKQYSKISKDTSIMKQQLEAISDNVSKNLNLLISLHNSSSNQDIARVVADTMKNELTLFQRI